MPEADDTAMADWREADEPVWMYPGEVVEIDFTTLTHHDWRMFPTAPHFVYAIRDAAGEVFYVGRCAAIASRFSHHRGKKGFGHRVAAVRFIACSSTKEAERIERAIIRLFRPSENIDHAGGN